MIANLSKGSEFGPLLHYIFHGRKASQAHRGFFFGGTILAGGQDELLAYYNYLKRLRPDVINPVHHVTVSLAPNETLSIAQWLKAADSIGSVMKWGHWSVFGHEDGNCEHVHVIGTRLSEGRVHPEQLRDQRLLMRCMRSLEIEFGLQRVTSPTSPRSKHGRVPQAKRATNKERQASRHNPKDPRKQSLREAIDEVIAAGYRQGGVLIELRRRNWEPCTTWRDGHPVGICFTDLTTGRRYTGARLGTEYSGKRFFARIGGFHGESRPGSTIDLNRIANYDTKRRWDNILRQLATEHRTMASVVRGNTTGNPWG